MFNLEAPEDCNTGLVKPAVGFSYFEIKEYFDFSSEDKFNSKYPKYKLLVTSITFT